MSESDSSVSETTTGVMSSTPSGALASLSSRKSSRLLLRSSISPSVRLPAERAEFRVQSEQPNAHGDKINQKDNVTPGDPTFIAQTPNIQLFEKIRTLLATAAAGNLNSRLGEGTTTINTVKHWFARFTSEDTDFEDKPRPERLHIVEDSAILDAVKEDPEINTRSLPRDSGVDIQQSSVASRLSATETYWLDGSFTP
ncbi:hypothetical protein RB195_024168 [Necator americanus]|uniref:Mos1 transposase HTH domain-containing protein n=1 Tax=Necator americanus TaxID=51031 RepID=A0ABR1EM77_NECAM